MSGRAEIADVDVWRIERLSDAAMRAGHTQEAIGGYALALRLRAELGMPAERPARRDRHNPRRVAVGRNRQGAGMTRHVTAEPVDPRERFGLYRLCDCPTCEGRGQVEVPRSDADRILKRWPPKRCADCRGEGRIREEVATAQTAEAVGVALVTLAREGEWEECPFGLLDREGETGKRWLVLPWPTTARTVRAAASELGKQSARKRSARP